MSMAWLIAGGSDSLLANDLANAVVDLTGRLRGIARSKGAENHEHGHDDGSKDHQLAEDWASVAKLLPLHATLSEVFLQHLASKLVVDETTQSNAVTESLEKRDGVLEQEHGCEDEEDVLQHTGESEDEG